MSTVKSKSLKSVNQMEKGIAMDKFKVALRVKWRRSLRRRG